MYYIKEKTRLNIPNFELKIRINNQIGQVSELFLEKTIIIIKSIFHSSFIE